MNHQDMVAKIMATYMRATPDQIIAGMRWYEKANTIARSIAERNNLGMSEACAIIAHLSPRTAWSLNVARAWELAETGTTSGLSRSVANAQAARSGSVTFGKTAHKTRAFAANIMGDLNEVTVDVWAARVAGVSDADLSDAKTYGYVATAYMVAARMAGIAPAQMQAVTWVVCRGSAE